MGMEFFPPVIHIPPVTDSVTGRFQTISYLKYLPMYSGICGWYLGSVLYGSTYVFYGKYFHTTSYIHTYVPPWLVNREYDATMRPR